MEQELAQRGAGRRWQAGWSRPGCGVRVGCAFGRGGAKGRIEKSGKEASPSLSLSPVCL